MPAWRGAIYNVLGRPDAWLRSSWFAAAAVMGCAVVGFAIAGFTPLRITCIATLGALVVGRATRLRPTSTVGSGPADSLVVIGAGLALLGLAGGGVGAPLVWGGRLAIVGAGYGLLIWGTVALYASRVRGRQADVLLEAGVSTLAVGVALWAATAVPGARPEVTLLAVVLPAVDAGLCTIFAQLVVLPGERVAAHRYLLLMGAWLFGSHLVSSLVRTGRLPGTGVTGTLLVVMALVSFAMASVHPSAELLGERLLQDPPKLSMAHVVLVIVAMLAGPGTIAIQAVKSVPVSGTTGVAVALVSVLLAAYMGNLLVDRADHEHRSTHDELTDLPNRPLLVDRASRAIGHARRAGSEVAVMFVDLDQFKAVNDTFGHAAGDTLLREVAQRLRKCVRDEDTVARIGGDEFVLLLPRVAGLDGTVTVAQRVKKAFIEPFPVGRDRLVVTASIGVAMYPHDGDDAADLLSAADSAMYRVKADGRNGFGIFSADLASRADERLAVETGIRAAIDEGNLAVYYQPSVDLESGRIVGAEALVRWMHPERGLIAPDDFIPVAERSDLIVAIGDWVLAETCEQLERWRLAEMPPLTVAVNVSVRQLRHGMADRVATALRATGVDPSSLVLELTETAAAGDIDLVALTLSEVRNMGVRWAIDDFGTGYCGLSYLSRLAVDTLKIDKSFVQGDAAADRTIVSAIVALGHSLGMSIVAEGVETGAQLAHLESLHCDRAQGYLFGRPMPAAEFEALVRRQMTDARELGRSSTVA
ncbi:MAG: hypothetical protein NVS3B21_31020 [Acidimicrobiales bacterium]